MLIKTFLSLGFTFLLLIHNSNCSKTDHKMIVSLSISQTDQGLFCHANFSNNGRYPFYLNKIDIGLDGEIRGKIFIIKKGEEVVPYEGILMKRRVVDGKDFVLLQPGESLKTIIQIDQAYGFGKGRHTYSIQYSYYHSSPEENPQLNKLESNIVFFEYNNP